MDYSHITVVGRVQPSDAETRFTPDGKPVLTFRFVSGRSRKNKEGEWENESDWYRITCFGPIANRFADRAVKGAKLLVSGRFSSREWTDNSGKNRTSLEILANELIDLADRPAPGTTAPAPTPTTSKPDRAPMTQYDLDDLPF